MTSGSVELVGMIYSPITGAEGFSKRSESRPEAVVGYESRQF